MSINESQELFDFIVRQIELSIREIGYGDVSVNKKMKVFITAFYGRITNYSQGVDQIQNNKDDQILNKAILNNIYKGKDSNSPYLKFFKDYILKSLEYFDSRDIKKNINERFKFIDFPLDFSTFWRSCTFKSVIFLKIFNVFDVLSFQTRAFP